MGKRLRKFSLLIVILGILTFVAFQMSSITIWAEMQSTQSDVDQEVSTFSNPAQAAHAENLAVVVAQKDPNVQAAFASLEAAETNLQNAKLSGDLIAIANAQAAYDTAKANAEAAFAQAAGVVVAEIADMRSDGLGWGEIAQALGVHPGVLGLGHTNRKGTSLAAEMQLATARDLQTGLSRGHGMSNEINSGDKSLGLGHVKSSHGDRRNDNISSHGLGNTDSHGGGHGGGHGGKK